MKGSFKELALAISFISFVGAAFVTSLAVGYFSGNWVDSHYLTHPLGKVMGICLGTIFAIYSIFAHIKRNFLSQSKDKEE